MVHSENFSFSVTQKHLQQHMATVRVARAYIDALYQEALIAQQNEAHTYGFSKGTTPLYYIEQNFRSNIIDHLKEFFFIHCVLSFLRQALAHNKIVIAGDPDLVDIRLEPQEDALFTFLFTHITLDNDDRWKKVNLRAPERKNYKDLDKQVESFIKEETEKAHNHTDNISLLDWVCFTMVLVDKNEQPLLFDYIDEVWVKINDEEADRELQQLFLGKKVGDTFYSNNILLQEYVSNKLTMNYTFKITIKDILPHQYFSFDHFNRHFGLKTDKEMHLKLIEVFSHRNDLSQRRETIEATLKLLLKQYFIILPPHLLERQRQQLLAQVHQNPDYHVYKAQNDFKEKIRLLAEKQLKETIIIDTIAYRENITVSHDDIVGYLNLLKRPRMKEFLYFDLPITKVNGQEVPLSTEVIKQYCLREKTLNYVIHYLTKKSKL